MEGKQAIPGQGKDSTSHICLFFKGSFCCQQKLGKKKKKVSGIASPLQYIQGTSSYILLMEGLDWNSCHKSGRGVIWGPLYSLDLGLWEDLLRRKCIQKDWCNWHVLMQDGLWHKGSPFEYNVPAQKLPLNVLFILYKQRKRALGCFGHLTPTEVTAANCIFCWLV